jgi:hypothetical protein
LPESWWINQEWFQLRWRRRMDHNWSQYMGRLVRQHSVTVTVNVLLQYIFTDFMLELNGKNKHFHATTKENPT